MHVLKAYVTGVQSSGIEISSRYLFRPLSHSDKEVLDAPLLSSVVYAKLKCYLKALDMDPGETPHNVRSVCTESLTLSRLGHSWLRLWL